MNKIAVIKIGTTSITKGQNEGIDFGIVKDIAGVTDKIQALGYKVIIVSSGAKALGMAKMCVKLAEKFDQNCKDNNQDLTRQKQALTSVGQIELMKFYQEAFIRHNIIIGQVLVTHRGLKDDVHNSTIKETIQKMFELDIVPIVNANDTVSSKALTSGDNDSLAARLSILMEAEKLFLLTDVDGLYTKDPNKHDDAKLIEEIEEIDEKIIELAGGTNSKSGTGGMRSKLNAAEICQTKGIHVEILDAKHTIDLDKFVLEKDHSMKSTTILPN